MQPQSTLAGALATRLGKVCRASRSVRHRFEGKDIERSRGEEAPEKDGKSHGIVFVLVRDDLVGV